MARFDDALEELYQAPVAQFVAERKRLAGELKTGGDAAGAKQLLARKRPTISAWVVNQLYWHARDAFDDLMATAEKLRKGDLKASAAHRDALAKLRKRASTLLEEAGHAPTESTLRRVTTTLSALAATGGFDPDPPGTLAADRDPPGFEAIGIPSGPIEQDEEPAPKKHDGHAKHDTKHDKHDGKDDLAKARAKARKDREKAEADEAERRATEMAEKKRAEEHKKHIAQERHRLEAALRNAKAEVHDKERDLKALEKQIAAAQKAIEKSQEIVDDLEAKLAELDEGN